MFLNNIMNKIKNNESTRNGTIPLCIENIILPEIIEKCSIDQISSLARELFSTYKSLGYATKSEDDLNKKEWSMWEFSIVLKFCKKDLELKIDESEKIFPQFILNYGEVGLRTRFQTYLEIYDKNRGITASQLELQNNNFWTPVDMTCLFYYLTIYKEFE